MALVSSCPGSWTHPCTLPWSHPELLTLSQTCRFLSGLPIGARAICLAQNAFLSPFSAWPSPLHSLRSMANVTSSVTPPPNPHLISGQSLLYFPQHFAHISILQHPQQYRDFLSRWIMSHLKTPFIAYSHTYLQLLTELLCT